MANKVLNILISPLDWGLGHASRCIPIIRYLLEKGHKIFVAASGLSLELLQKNFKNENIHFFHIKGYNISYAQKGSGFAFKIFKQLPHIASITGIEHKWLTQIVDQYKIDLVISDNRYGIYHPKVYSIFITHQYQILSGMNALADRTLLKWHESKMKHFDEIWLVDEKEENFALAVKLSHPSKIKTKNVQYIGHLSQFENAKRIETETHKILLLLSGPEPARSQLYQLFLAQAELLPAYQFVIITGSNLPLSNSTTRHIQQYGISDQAFIQSHLLDADLIVCRSGYSTIMDLVAIKKKALLIPTPGQTEQIYIAKELSNKGLFFYTAQDDFSLVDQIKKAEQFKGFTDARFCANQQFKIAIDNSIQKIIAMHQQKSSQ